jgi:hypothetical protein
MIAVAQIFKISAEKNYAETIVSGLEKKFENQFF